MKDGAVQAMFFGSLIVIAYGLYLWRNPEADGVIFGGVLTAIAGVGGYVIGAIRAKAKE